MIALACLAAPPARASADGGTAAEYDLVIVGAGIAGLSAAAEAGAAGARTLVVDMASVFGGHAMMSHGGLSLAGTPLQQSKGIQDDPKQAIADAVAWGVDPDRRWTERYFRASRPEVHDWVSGMGVEFESMMHFAGNSVPRFHVPRDRGYGLVAPIYRRCLSYPNVEFVWNVQITELLKSGGRVVGVKGMRVRHGTPFEARGSAVVLATGGFQSNLQMVRQYGPKALDAAARILEGSGQNSKGFGHKLATAAGADLTNLDKQWNYVTGLPDPAHPGGERGLSAWNQSGLWVNAQGRRFVHDDWFLAGNKAVLEAVLKQKPASYWLIFDEGSKKDMGVSGTGWDTFEVIDQKLLQNASLTKRAATLEALAKETGLPEKALVETVARYNAAIDAGTDAEFGRFKDGKRPPPPGARPGTPQLGLPPKLVNPPYYAIQMLSLARKSLGGVRIDGSCRALDKRGKPVPGLYAAGEVTGFAGVNGRAGLEGTFLGPSIYTGRVAARAAVADLKRPLEPVAGKPVASKTVSASAVKVGNSACTNCHDLPKLVEQKRKGFWHFENAHRLVLQRNYPCVQCHAELAPHRPGDHKVDPVARIENCAYCHGKPR